MLRYDLDFGSANAGGAPAFLLFVDTTSGNALAQPAIVERGAGLYYFDYEVPAGVASVTFKVTLNGIELSDTINARGKVLPAGPPGQGLATLPASCLTVAKIVSRAAVQLGLGATGDDPFGSQDPNVQQLLELLTSVGDDLRTVRPDHKWSTLRREYSFVTEQGQNVYPLPADFHELVDQTPWNRTTRRPLGSLSAQRAQAFKSLGLRPFLVTVYRIQGGLIEINPGATVPAGLTVAFDYVSTSWVRTSGESAPDKGEPTAPTDVVCFDAELVIAALKARWLEAKGFDTLAALARFEEKLTAAISRDSAAPVVSLDGRAGVAGEERFLDCDNLPPTGWGQG